MTRSPLVGIREWRLAEPVARALLWGAAFWIAYRLQVRLEGFHTNWRELLYLLAACGLMAIAAWPGKETDAPGGSDSATPAHPAEAGARYQAWLPFALPGLILIAAVALGVFFRVYDLNERPIGISYDEAQNGLIVRRILNGDYPAMFIGRDTQLPSAIFYLYALSARAFGEGILSLRIVSMMGGLAALPLLFLAARELFGLRTAVIATFLLAVMRWHVNFSRFGVSNIFAAALVTGAIAFFARGLRSGERWNFVVAGVFVGMTPYTGFYGVFVAIVIGLYWLHTGIFERVRPWRSHVAAIVIVAAAAMAVYSPVALWSVKNGEDYLYRPGTVSILTGKSASEAYDALKTSTRKHVLMFNSRGDRNGRHNLPYEPMLDRFTGILFILGVGLAVTRLHRPNHFLLLVWVAAFLQNGIWTVEFEAPQAFRSSAVTPAVAMLAALPLAALWDIAARSTAGRDADPRARVYSMIANRGVRAAATVTVVALLGLVAQRNFDTYFNKQLDDPQVWRDWNTDIAFVAKEVDEAKANETVLLSSLFSSPVIDFVDKDRNQNRYQLDLTRDIPAGGEGSATVLLDVTKRAYIEWIKALYPSAQVTAFGPPGTEEVQVYRIVIAAKDVQALKGLEAMYEREGMPAVERRQATFDADWTATVPPLPFPFRARWSASVRILDLTGAALEFSAPGAIRMAIDGGAPIEGRDSVTTPTLYRGLHRIVIDAEIERGGAVSLSQSTVPVEASNIFSGGAVDDPRGLVATFYLGADFAGDPVLYELDPFIGYRYHAELAFGSPFSAVWRGRLRVDRAGPYAIRAGAAGEAEVTVDGNVIVPFPGQREATLLLAAGDHPIEVRYRNTTGSAEIYLYWKPPEGEPVIIPSENLRP